MGSARRWEEGGTFDALFGPSSLEMCSRACLGRSATVLVLALPNRKDILSEAGCLDALGRERECSNGSSGASRASWNGEAASRAAEEGRSVNGGDRVVGSERRETIVQQVRKGLSVPDTPSGYGECFSSCIHSIYTEQPFIYLLTSLYKYSES